MLVESICIILLFLIMAFVFLRRGQKKASLAVLVLAILPFVHSLSLIACDLLSVKDILMPVIVADVCAVAVSEILLGVIAVSYKSKRSRITLATLCSLFIIVLAIILILHIYSF